MTKTLQRSTASELFEMPDEGFRYELVKGGLRKMSPSAGEHGLAEDELDGGAVVPGLRCKVSWIFV